LATLIGGTGSVTFVVNNASDVIQAQSTGTNAIQTSVSYTAADNVQNLAGTGIADLMLTGNTLTDVITANSGNDTLIAGSRVATLVGGTGNDIFVVNNMSDIVQAQSTGTNTNTIQTSVSYTAADKVQNLTGTGSAALTLTGNSLDITITANSGSDTLIAGSGNDTLIAGSGVSKLIGGTGSDTFVVNSASDVVQAQSTGTNINTINTSVSYVAPANVQNLTGTGSAALTLTGNALSNTIIGNGGSDTLIAGSGNDTLIAGNGVATLVGGTGNDTFVVNNTLDVVQAKVGGTNTIQTSVNYTASTSVLNLTGTGSADLTLTGNTLTDVITANSGNDTLIAGSGVATLVGGTGNDTFVVNKISDVIQAQSTGSNTNTIQTSVSYTNADNVQYLTGTGSANITLTSSWYGSDVVTANIWGNDTLVDGSYYGNVTMVGGYGNDTFVVNDTSDIVQSTGYGTNTIQSSVDYTASANVQKLTGTGMADITLTGGSYNGEVITANYWGYDTLVAGSGIATLVGGGTGGDTFVVNNVYDVVQVSANTYNAYCPNEIQTSVSYTIAANVQYLTGIGSADLTLTGNAYSGDVITANSGNDWLVAGSGIVTLVGGTGNDTFVVKNINDVVQAQSTGSNTNTIQSSVSYTASDNVQNLMGTGSAAISLTGNQNSNEVITANYGNDTLIGGGGNDTLVAGIGNDWLVAGSGLVTLVGGSGNDTFVVNNTADIVQALSNYGYNTNTIQTSVSYTAADNVIKLTGTGSGNITLTGNQTLAVLITANSGNDTLVAGTNWDTLVGGTGNDTFVVKNAGDIVQAKSGGINTIQTSASYTASINVQDLFGTGTAAITLTGNSGNDLIIGNSGTDTLTGGSGTNVLEAGFGNSTLKDIGGANALIAGSGNDTLIGGTKASFIAGGAGSDAITLGAGTAVVAFNTGDGAATITHGTGRSNVLSLGGGIDYSNLAFSKSGNNLILNTGGTNSITFVNWYAGVANQNFVTLQVLEQAANTYNPNSTNALYNSAVEEFNFTQLVNDFNAALAATPSLTNWSLMNTLLNDHLSGSNTTALGGDLAYYDGLNGNLTGMNLATAVTTLQNATFGKTAQTIDAWGGISGGNALH